MSALYARISQIGSLIRASRTLRWVPIPPARPSEGVSVIYQRPSPLWARWANVLVALDVMMVTTVIEYTWNLSGLSSPKEVLTKGIQESEDLKDLPLENVPEHLADRLLLQPYWKKAVFSGIYVTSGVLCGAALLASRARLLRAVSFAKGGPGKRSGTLYFQTASHPKGYGVPIPMKDCSIVKGDMPSRLVLRVIGLGGWTLNLRGATINGQAVPKDKIDVARVAMLRAWAGVGGRVAAPAASN